MDNIIGLDPRAIFENARNKMGDRVVWEIIKMALERHRAKVAPNCDWDSFLNMYGARGRWQRLMTKAGRLHIDNAVA